MDEMLAELANGKLESVDVVGPVEVKFENRSTFCRAALPGESEALSGSIPMEDISLFKDHDDFIVGHIFNDALAI